MTLTLSLPPEFESRLRERAAASGKDVASFVREAIEEKLAAKSGASATARDKTMRDLITLLESSPGLNDGWAEAVEEVIRIGNTPPAESTWAS